MTFKDGVMFTLIIAAALAFIVGIGWLIIWDNSNDEREFKENCANVAKIAGLKEYKTDGYDCFILKDNKIVEVKL